MSIIYDALKKVQKNNGKDETPQEETAQPVKTKIKINPMLIYILVVCLGLALGNLAYNFFGHSNNMVPSNKEVAGQSKANPPLQTLSQTGTALPLKPDTSANPTPPANPEPTLALNGVFFEQGEGYALINNKIVRVGDEISNAKVKEIAITGVELEFEGKTIKLASPS
ncbi:MAG: hypothetical protein Q7K98_05770 [Candidatus Omnitrophota bacterium]|nr:hypothetical protein [Candidatus Omnitrophota bacterium]